MAEIMCEAPTCGRAFVDVTVAWRAWRILSCWPSSGCNRQIILSRGALTACCLSAEWRAESKPKQGRAARHGVCKVDAASCGHHPGVRRTCDLRALGADAAGSPRGRFAQRTHSPYSTLGCSENSIAEAVSYAQNSKPFWARPDFGTLSLNSVTPLSMTSAQTTGTK